MIIGLARVDDRLIHGQVATVWTKEANVSRIIVVSDEVVKDNVRSTLLKQVAPPGVTASVIDVAKSARVFNNPKYAKDRVMLLFTTPIDAERAIEAGIPIKDLNIGGISYKEGSVQLNKSIFVTKEQADCLRRLNDNGVKLDPRGVVTDPRENLIGLLDQNNM